MDRRERTFPMWKNAGSGFESMWWEYFADLSSKIRTIPSAAQFRKRNHSLWAPTHPRHMFLPVNRQSFRDSSDCRGRAPFLWFALLLRNSRARPRDISFFQFRCRARRCRYLTFEAPAVQSARKIDWPRPVPWDFLGRSHTGHENSHLRHDQRLLRETRN